MEEIHKYIAEEVNKYNNRSLIEFEGYSPFEMHHILYNTFAENSPIKISKATQDVYQAVPIFNQVKFLLEHIYKNDGLKLTKKGYLPTKIVAELYDKGYIKDYFIESGLYKLYRESDVPSINLTRILVELSVMVKKRHDKLTLTKKGIQIIKNDHLVFEEILKTFTQKFNWSYYDNYDDERIGQFGFGFTFILFNKYGTKFQNPEFYAAKYLQALKLISVDSKSFDHLTRAYTLRTFERFMDYFGFTEYQNDSNTSDVKKSKLFDKLIKIEKHKIQDE